MTGWIHFANVLYLVSYLVQDILWLRVLTVVAALSLIPYYATNWLGEAIAWNVVFLVINVVQIKLLMIRRLIKVLLFTDVGQCYRRKASVKPDGYSRYFSRAPTNFRSIMLFLETCKRSIVA